MTNGQIAILGGLGIIIFIGIMHLADKLARVIRLLEIANDRYVEPDGGDRLLQALGRIESEVSSVDAYLRRRENKEGFEELDRWVEELEANIAADEEAEISERKSAGADQASGAEPDACSSDTQTRRDTSGDASR